VIETEVRGYRAALTLDRLEVDGKPGRFSMMQGRAVPYDEYATIGMFYRERHAVNSLKRSTDTAARALPLLLFHDAQSFPVGSATQWRHEADGVYGTWKISDSAEAQRAASAAYDGELTGLSVGFIPERSSWEHVEDWAPDLGPDHMDAVTHLESRLVEVSLTPTPAYDDAGVTLVRTAWRTRQRGTPQADAWRSRVDALRR